MWFLVPFFSYALFATLHKKFFSAEVYVSDNPVSISAKEIDKLDGQWGLFFVFSSDSGLNICELYNVQFVSE